MNAFGHKANLDKMMNSKNVMENVMNTAKKARLKEISKILLTDEDVEYVRSHGWNATLLEECLSSPEVAKETLGNVNIITEPIPGQIVLKPYRIWIE